jgi:hypothetical protein
MVDQEEMMYLATTILVAFLVLVNANASIFGPFVVPVVIFALLAIVAILMINYADFIAFPLFTTIFGISVIPGKGYIIPKNETAIIKYTNGLYYATGYITANLYKYVFTAQNQGANEETEIATATDRWERAIMSINFPFKFNVISTALDIQAYRDEVESRRGLLEFQLAREMNSSNPSTMTINELQRKINITQMRIERLGNGEKPINTLMYVETTAVGISEKETLDLLSNQIAQLQTVMNVFDLSMSRISGRELQMLYKMNYSLPSGKDFDSMFQKQK